MGPLIRKISRTDIARKREVWKEFSLRKRRPNGSKNKVAGAPSLAKVKRFIRKVQSALAVNEHGTWVYFWEYHAMSVAHAWV